LPYLLGLPPPSPIESIIKSDVEEVHHVKHSIYFETRCIWESWWLSISEEASTATIASAANNGRPHCTANALAARHTDEGYF
jgi:hypothetical protein